MHTFLKLLYVHTCLERYAYGSSLCCTIVGLDQSIETHTTRHILQVGNWFRITVDVQQPVSALQFFSKCGRIKSIDPPIQSIHPNHKQGVYTADLYFTCPNGGTVTFSMADYHTGLTIDEQTVELDRSVFFHDWLVAENALTMLLKPGWSIFTLNMTSVGGDPTIHFGNWIWINFRQTLGA